MLNFILNEMLTENEIFCQGRTCRQMCKVLIIFFSTGAFYRENPVLSFYLLSSQLYIIIYYSDKRDKCVDGFEQNAVKSLL